MKRIAQLLLALSLILAGRVHGKTITVGPAGGGYNHTTITAGLAAAVDGDTISVAPSVYATATGEAFPITIDKAVILQAMVANNRPHLQGDHLNTVISILVPNVTLRGLRITDGSGSEGIYGMDGGGVCVFVNDDASGFVLITDCLIEQNTCPFDETYNGCGGGIYCGGTWCTCFEIGIVNTVIRSNGIPVNHGVFGNGGGVFCGMLSKVWIEDCDIEANSANDRGGGVFVDSYGLVMVKNSHLRWNVSPGDPTRAGWGGKGGGVFLDGEAVCTVAGCDISGNAALYYGGGLFTMSGLTDTSTGTLCTNSGGRFFTMSVLSNVVSSSLIASNTAGVSGGGAYIRDHAYLAFHSTTNYWNDATGDGAGLYVAGATGGGGKVEFADQCLLEGNECTGRGAGVFLGMNTRGVFRDTRFLGNSSGLDGGAAFLDSGAAAALTNCLITYNNAARGYGGAFRLLPTASLQLQHCSVVGNFAPYARSGFFLDTNATLSVANSILWRNAGGSVQTNGATFLIAASLDEDGPAPLTGTPGFLGWGTNNDIYVSAAGNCHGSGTSNSPFCSLQVALDRYDFRLAASSSCVGAASDGGHIGANTGVDGATGNTVATLNLGAGTYDIRGRNIIFTRGLLGAGASNSAIAHTVFGYVEDTYIRDLAITGERWFGGLVLRGSADVDRVRVFANTALLDGGGIYICESNTVSLNNCDIDLNQSGLNGGGLFIRSNTWVALNGSQIADNGCQYEGGGAFVMGYYGLTNSFVARNTAKGVGGGLRLGGVGTIQSSLVASNTAHKDGGGIYVSGQLAFNHSTNLANRADTWYYHGGGIYVAPTAVVDLLTSCFLTNYAAGVGGALMINNGVTHARTCLFLGNSANTGGAVFCGYREPSADFSNCDFASNSANDGGAVFLYDNSQPIFTACRFVQNYANYSGGAASVVWNFAVLEHCSFTSNSAAYNSGGALMLQGSDSLVLNCGFTNNRAIYTSGGSVHIQTGDRSRLVGCTIAGSYAGDSGGGVNIREGSTRSQLIEVLVADSRAVKYGGGIACREGAAPGFEQVVITNCSAILGGGVYADGTSSSTFDRCCLYGNRAESAVVSADGGGGYFTDASVGWLTHCLFQGNSADNDGAGFIALGTATVTVTNTWFLNNQATNTGGAVKFTASSSGLFQNCTIVGNSAITNGGGGILLDSQAAVIMDSSILYSNRDDGIARAGGTLTVKWSCIQPPWPGSWTGVGNTNANPLLDTAGLFLQSNSPCVDAGNPYPALNDTALPPGQGTPRNDMGATGGPLNGWTPAASETLWIPPGVLWSYYDSGSELPGTWCAPSYDDTTWNHGRAKFGYGGDGEVTTVSFGTNAAQKHITTYFRCAFNVPDLAAATNSGTLEARLVCDDGAVVYFNGVEAFRYNMPVGMISHNTLASSDIVGADENRWFTFPIDPRLLVQGANVVAVQVHQVALDSGDLGFDFQLTTHSGFNAGPKTIYVNDDSSVGDTITSAGGSDDNAGLDPAHPLRHVSTAFSRYTLEPGDTIWLDTGIYEDSVTVPSGTRGITLRGAGMDRSIIDAGQLTNCLVLIYVQGVTIKDLTLRHGEAARLLYDLPRGGALLCNHSDLYMTNVALRDSTAAYGGGAWVDRSDLILHQVVFSGNLATNQGGGLFLDFTEGPGARHLVTNCVFSANQAYGQGGGLFVTDGLIQDCTINGNTASDHGGGACLFQRSRIEGCSLTTNRANYAGGAYLADWVTMRDCTLVSNTASIDGGGLRSWSSTPLSNCVFLGNVAFRVGGGANFWNSALARKCTFADNRALYGGGLTLDGNALALDCVITSNIATNESGGIRLWSWASVSNCLVASNLTAYGGGMGAAGNATVRDCVITNNTATVESGGLRVWESASVSNCLLAANCASSAGGLSLHHNARGQDCIIMNNTAADAGGLRLYDSSGISNCRISGNVATNWGGGVVAHHSSTLEDCWIWSNRATWGGGVDLVDTSVARDCVISNNAASTDGGGVYMWNSARLSHCAITANSAMNNSGGGVYCNGSGLVQSCLVLDNAAVNWAGGGVCIVNGGGVRNSLMRGNVSKTGGGLYLLSGTAENCTIAANSASKGGGLYLESGAVSNSIIYFNQSPSGSNYFNTSLKYSYSRCCIAPNIANGNGIIVADPRFLNAAAMDFRLATDSPCVDFGINASWMDTATDLEEKPRILNGIVDLGAYETIPIGWASPRFVAGQYLLNGKMKLTIFGEVGRNYTLFASSNLTDWFPLLSFDCTKAIMDVFDPDAGDFNCRFYRLRTP